MTLNPFVYSLSNPILLTSLYPYLSRSALFLLTAFSNPFPLSFSLSNASHSKLYLPLILKLFFHFSSNRLFNVLPIILSFIAFSQLFLSFLPLLLYTLSFFYTFILFRSPQFLFNLPNCYFPTHNTHQSTDHSTLKPLSTFSVINVFFVFAFSPTYGFFSLFTCFVFLLSSFSGYSFLFFSTIIHAREILLLLSLIPFIHISYLVSVFQIKVSLVEVGGSINS